jgi:hypothetical protein
MAIVTQAPLAGAAEPGEELTISVLTMGPGDHPFYKFGHNAVLVHDERRHRDDVYNYGTFDFSSPTLVRDFLGGRLLYWLSVQSLGATLAHYRAERRSIVAQELRLTPAERRSLADRLAHDALLENRAYRYDYYRDNCSTRVRDALDAVLDGRLRAASRSPASLTFRGHTERLTADDVGFYLGLDVAMGGAIDQRTTQWEEMFLPSKLQETLRRLRVPTSDGEESFVVRETELLGADRPPLRGAPPRWGLAFGAGGALAGAVLVILGWKSRRHRAARVAFGVLLTAMGLVLGLLGCIFVFLWLGTDHLVAHHNENILPLRPAGHCPGSRRPGRCLEEGVGDEPDASSDGAVRGARGDGARAQGPPLVRSGQRALHCADPSRMARSRSWGARPQ